MSQLLTNSLFHNFTDKTTSKWLLKAKVNQYPLEKCKNLDIFQNKKIKIINSQFCARSQLGKDTCQGDSGGPLFYEESKKSCL